MTRYWLCGSRRPHHLAWQPIQYLNELELINGELYANIYLTDRIARIDPTTGQVLTMLDLSGLCPDENLKAHGEVLNGIAYDVENDRLFVTGKHWPWLYEISLRPIPEPIIPTLTLTPTKLRVPIPEFQGPKAGFFQSADLPTDKRAHCPQHKKTR